MGLQVFWAYSPPDGRYSSEPSQQWRSDFKLLRNNAQALDALGFAGVLVAIGPHRIYEGWTLASSMIGFTERLRWLVAVYPGIIGPTQLAFMARTFDRLSGGRLMLNIVGSNPGTMSAHGVHLPKAERYQMLDEYWTLFTKIYAGQDVPKTTRYFHVENPESQFRNIPPTQFPHPELWAAGGSDEGLPTVVKFANTYLGLIDAPHNLKTRMDKARAVAASRGITIPHFGISLPVIVRDTEEEAWIVANNVLRNMAMETIHAGSGWAAALALESTTTDPAVKRSIEAIKAGRYPNVRDLEVYPNIWCGPNAVSALDVTRTASGPGATIVGNPEQVAARMREYHDVAGIDRFILRGSPLIEEIHHVAEKLFPLLDLEDPPPALLPVRSTV